MISDRHHRERRGERQVAAMPTFAYTTLPMNCCVPTISPGAM